MIDNQREKMKQPFFQESHLFGGQCNVNVSLEYYDRGLVVNFWRKKAEGMQPKRPSEPWKRKSEIVNG